MNDKIKRIITATIVIPPLLIIIIFSNKVFFYLVMEFFIFISLYEFIRMLKIMNYKYFKMPVILAALLMPVIVDTQNFQFLLIFLLLVVFIVFTLKLFSINPLEDTFITTGLTFVTIFYIPFFFSFLYLIKG
jgi:phosphatidate cytidylyltransferase